MKKKTQVKKAEKKAKAPVASAKEVDTKPVEKAKPTAKAEKKHGGRKPMTAAEKAAAAKLRAEEKKKAESMVPVMLLQYQGDEVDTATLIEAAKADFKEKHKRTLITDLKLYLKPEERAAYYVINGSSDGKVTY